MSGNSKIEWTGKTWNPIRARLKQDALIRIWTPAEKLIPAGTWGYHCERVSPGCSNCYACTMNGRTLPAWGTGLDYTVPNREKVEIYLDEHELTAPLRWRKPTKIFPCSMTDLFADFVPDEFIDRVFAVMALCPQHTFQVLTKRAKRMREYMGNVDLKDRVDDETHEYLDQHEELDTYVEPWPLPNVQIGVSVEDQPRADERIVELLATPACVRWVSYEPALGAVDFTRIKTGAHIREFMRKMAVDTGRDPEKVLADCAIDDTPWRDALNGDWFDGWDGGTGASNKYTKIDWIVVGGESGRDARPFDLAWARQTIAQGKAAGVPVFVKQLGAKPWDSASSDIDHLFEHCGHECECCTECPSNEGQRPRGEHPQILKLKDRKGGDPSEWPADLRVRELPEARP